MGVVGLNFNKLLVERKKAVSGKITINNNIAVKNVEERDLALGKNKQSGLRFVFEFTSKYNPDLANISIEGEVLYLEEAVKVKKIVEEWSKNKKIDKDMMADVLNSALTKCNVQALILANDVNLPPPLQLPRIEKKDKGSTYIG